MTRNELFRKRMLTAFLAVIAFYVVESVGSNAYTLYQSNNQGKINAPYSELTFNQDLTKLKNICDSYEKVVPSKSINKVNVFKESDNKLNVLDEGLLVSINSLTKQKNIQDLKSKLISLQQETRIKLFSSPPNLGFNTDEYGIRPLTLVDSITQEQFEKYVFNSFYTAIAFNIDDSISSINAGKTSNGIDAFLARRVNSLTKVTTNSINLSISNDINSSIQAILYHEIVGHYHSIEWGNDKRACSYLKLLKMNSYSDSDISSQIYGLLTYDQEPLLGESNEDAQYSLSNNQYFKNLEKQGLSIYSMFYLYRHLEQSKSTYFDLDALGNNFELESTMSESLTSLDEDNNPLLLSLEIIASKTNNSKYTLPEFRILLTEFNKTTNVDERLIIARKMKNFLRS